MRELLRAAFVIARRDFNATVFSKSFLLFLLGPLFPVFVVAVFGGLAQTTSSTEERVVAAVVDRQDYAALSRARERIATALPGQQLVELRRVAPERDSDALRHRLLHAQEEPVLAVLEGGLESPRLVGAVSADGTTIRQLQLIIEDARRLPAEAEPAGAAVELVAVDRSAGSVASARSFTARIAQTLMFVLTMLLATMTLSQLIEEKSNKIIEVLAAAVPVDSMFLGKLLAMLGTSLVGIAVWTAAAAAAVAVFTDGLPPLLPPTLGWTAFLLLGLVYFAMSYLLLGAIFLAVGSHASTAREVQVLSMPATMAQIVVFAVAALAVAEPDSRLGIGAAIFPLTSPYVMVARAAQLPELWPHLLAIGWQLLWVAIILAIASHLFRRSVLKSGPSKPRKAAART